ncbi:MAG: 2,3-bisphosphoglycerate-independent phosphoglycerate mutase [Candidatus Colwellbacteria bacterium]|jgi:2,3-bisphosphoglycerate-independent phosphoglycerate mutase|nr:2,3-bisphosphoglycerate-independent phosphoglycerate mutase [Candidatus Colwellbacteria bacterium]MCK9497349.1 2,3-bisphosphoglycerate-independent phosphoglycerate mutase [Candidatus Colwellbacteria bacterium]MDD3752711.1 2,3-bisphosphoglycerate-independent phosphoglycerate mutase [Candidatus Colwellbacteria bacterium]MDD4818747.1 2,3-bisphosphoglycerate-independent phosphoglycerate mutase [Candidatus Colwellbacteria bacterium]
MPDTNSYQKIALIILDGWGIGPKNNSNPIHAASLPNIKNLISNFPYLSLQSAGLAIGLPWQEEGNSEIGHLTIGAGRIVYQSAATIDQSIDNGSFFDNKVLLQAFEQAKNNNSSVCLTGLLGSGITHSSFKHLSALIQMAEKIGIDYKLHLFTDGRDASPRECLDLIKKLPEEKIGSLSGRFYAMDRDNHIERTKEAFGAMVGNNVFSGTPSEYLEKSYLSGITDEFIRPIAFKEGSLAIKKSDSIIFFNFRKDRMRQMANLTRELFPETHICSFTKYESENNIPAAFSLGKIDSSLPELIAKAGMAQLRVAESEKKAHVTYFFNAEKEEPFPQEFRVIIPSRKIARHDDHPEMMAEEITTRVTAAVEEGLYGFILANYANPDIVAHTGNFDATIKAVEIIDKEIGLISEACLKTGTTLIITSDHGNAEQLIDPRTGEKDTKHNANPVPFIVVDNRFKKQKSEEEINDSEKIIVGSLCDIAPTILELMGIQKPAEMTGQSLISYLK